jgi:hypothetical protein
MSLVEAVKSYVETTVDEEWPMLASGKFNQQAEDLADQLGSAVARLPVTSPAHQVLLDHLLTQYENMITQRHLRLFEASAGVHPLLWILLAGGAFITIGFTYFFGIDNAWGACRHDRRAHVRDCRHALRHRAGE